MNRFNPSQNKMQKTGLSSKNLNDGEYLGTNMGTLSQNGKEFGITSSNSSSLKGKLQSLEVFNVITYS